MAADHSCGVADDEEPALFKDEDTKNSTGAGSGRGGALGTPSFLTKEAPPSVDQEANGVVSGGGLTGPDDEKGPSDAAESSPSSQAP